MQEHALKVTYDQRDKSFLISNEETGEMLWARNIVVALAILKRYFSDSQAREGVLRAVFNNGVAVNMQHVEKYAKLVEDEGESPKKIAEKLYQLADSLVAFENEGISAEDIQKIHKVLGQVTSEVVWRKCPICSNYFAGTRDYGRCPTCGWEFRTY